MGTLTNVDWPLFLNFVQLFQNKALTYSSAQTTVKDKKKKKLAIKAGKLQVILIRNTGS